ncbi:Manganese transporter pdt1 [Mycena venus]|uniref:Manganese transporter pdt1 n=1 Tax=Mycena venus TaxID=2733690 RepID=A0A8H7D6G7_9AGAR|nr:Manganese transporter pdt1 [Mycena venus]
MSDTPPNSSRWTLYTHLKSVGSMVAFHLKKHAGVRIHALGSLTTAHSCCRSGWSALWLTLTRATGGWIYKQDPNSDSGCSSLCCLPEYLQSSSRQVMATRLGCVTGLDLASHCRLLFYDRPKHPLRYRWLGLYLLYILSEVAIISTDLAELLGSAIALCLLFPRLELWHGVLITAFDVVILLALRDPLRSTPVKMFEILIAGLASHSLHCLPSNIELPGQVLAVLISIAIVIAKVNVNWPRTFEGFLPSKYIFGDGGLYISVGILGATVMPHSLFLGSALATQDRLNTPAIVKLESLSVTNSREPTTKTTRERSRLDRVVGFLASQFRAPSPSQSSTSVNRHADRENNSLEFVRAHLNHGIVDMVGSLLGFAVLINSLILILASMVFFYGTDGPKLAASASLFDAYDLIHDLVGAPAATLFAIALLAAGQSSSIIATVAGQAVSEGFLNWRVSPVVRRLLTRLIAVIPSVAVAVAVGRPGIDALLVASQVILAIVLPFVTLPLIYLTSSRTIMRVRKNAPGVTISESENWIDYSNGMATKIVGCAIWLILLTANVYVIVTLIIGTGQ